MKNIKLTLSYRGSLYLGWQKTTAGPSIEESLEKALKRLLQEEVSLQAASRTDAGVHAEGQVVNFFTAKEILSLQKGLNALLPKEIRITAVEIAEDSFHPTLDAIAKEYWYHVCNGVYQLPFYRDASWHFSFPLSLEKMGAAKEHLLGLYDFSSLCNDNAIPKRGALCRLDEIKITPLPEKRLRFSVIGNPFLYKMVRNLVGLLLHVGCGKIEEDAIPSILASKDRKRAGVTAPAHGLLLKQVFYNDLAQ